MSSRIGFALATLLLLLAAALRMWDLTTLPSGLHMEEIRDLRIAESVRAGRIEVFYDLTPLGAEGGREGLYHTFLTSTTVASGGGLLGFRLPSVMVNLVALALVYAVAMRLYGPLAGVAALALLTLSMWPILLARVVGRETFLPLLVAAVMLALAKALPVYRMTPAGTIPYAALALLLGLGLYIHPTAFFIILASMIFIAFVVLSRRRVSRRALSSTSFAILLMIIIATPYLISSLRLPELNGAGRVFGDYTIAARPPLNAILSGITGLFFVGDSRAAYNLPGRPLVDLVSGLLILVGILAALRQWKRPRFTLLLLMLLSLAPVSFLSTSSPDSKAYVALLPLLALFFGLGVVTLYRSLSGRVRLVFALGFAALLAFNLLWTGRDLFDLWPELPETQNVYNQRTGQLAHYLDLTAGEIPTVICTPSITPRGPQPGLTSTQLILLMMHRSTPFRYADCGSGMIFSNGGERQQVVLTEENMLDDLHAYIRDWLRLGVIKEEDGVPANSVIMMDVSQQLADRIGSFTTQAPVTYAPEAPGGAQTILTPVSFGDNIAFLGYEPETGGAYTPDSDVTTITYWRADGPLPPDLVTFTHILADPAAAPVAQRDGISVLPANLRNRDVFIQISFTHLPASIPDGEYTVSVGVYKNSSSQRSPIQVDGQQRGDRLFLSGKVIAVAAPPGG